jgi:ABC-2 type transport system permease protein
MVLKEDALVRGHMTYYGPQGPGAIRGMNIRGAVVQSALEVRLAEVGAMCSTEEEAQQAQSPVLFLLIGPILALLPIMENPNAPWAVVTSMVPCFSPVLLYARAGAGAIPHWQVGVSLTFLYLGVWGVAWVAGRIYRVGILMQGKRPTLPELWRWLREA